MQSSCTLLKRRGRALAAILITTSAFVAGCGDEQKTPTVAGQNLPATGTNAPSKSGDRGNALAYSRCMRAHGVAAFPDPDSKGQIKLNATPENGLSFDSPQMKAAMEACKDLEPHLSESEGKAEHKQALKFAKCMRDNGVKDFPDPKPPGSGPQTQSSTGGDQQSQGPDPESPAFKRAQQACRDLVPSGAEFGTSSAP